jgi:hypothetical protein
MPVPRSKSTLNNHKHNTNLVSRSVMDNYNDIGTSRKSVQQFNQIDMNNLDESEKHLYLLQVIRQRKHKKMQDELYDSNINIHKRLSSTKSSIPSQS